MKNHPPMDHTHPWITPTHGSHPPIDHTHPCITPTQGQHPPKDHTHPWTTPTHGPYWLRQRAIHGRRGWPRLLTVLDFYKATLQVEWNVERKMNSTKFINHTLWLFWIAVCCSIALIKFIRRNAPYYEQWRRPRNHMAAGPAQFPRVWTHTVTNYKDHNFFLSLAVSIFKNGEGPGLNGDDGRRIRGILLHLRPNLYR
jgi:hypothetical protein